MNCYHVDAVTVLSSDGVWGLMALRRSVSSNDHGEGDTASEGGHSRGPVTRR